MQSVKTNASVIKKKKKKNKLPPLQLHQAKNVMLIFLGGDVVFLPQRVLLTGFIRVFTTSLTSQRAEKLQYPQTGGDRLPGN